MGGGPEGLVSSVGVVGDHAGVGPTAVVLDLVVGPTPASMANVAQLWRSTWGVTRTWRPCSPALAWSRIRWAARWSMRCPARGDAVRLSFGHLRRSGRGYNSFVSDGHSEYVGRDAHRVTSPAVHDELTVAADSDHDAFVDHLRRHERIGPWSRGRRVTSSAVGPAGRKTCRVAAVGTASAWADRQVAAVRDYPAGRIALVKRLYHGPFGTAPRHLPYRRAAMSFMRWQLRRGVLEPAHGVQPGSPWWRAVNERLLRDGCEAVALSGGLAGPVSSPTAAYWKSFADDPTARAWYRAHNASVVAAYCDHLDLAENENAAERFFMNVVLCRVLYTHALVAAPRLSLGWLRPLAPFLGDPRLGMTGVFLQLSRVLPAEYPLTDDVATYLSNELGFGRLLDYGVIVPRLQQLYEWSAHELGQPKLLDWTRDGALTYAWPFEERSVWQPRNSVVLRTVWRVLPTHPAATTTSVP